MSSGNAVIYRSLKSYPRSEKWQIVNMAFLGSFHWPTPLNSTGGKLILKIMTTSCTLCHDNYLAIIPFIGRPLITLIIKAIFLYWRWDWIIDWQFVINKIVINRIVSISIDWPIPRSPSLLHTVPFETEQLIYVRPSLTVVRLTELLH